MSEIYRGHDRGISNGMPTCVVGYIPLSEKVLWTEALWRRSLQREKC